MAYKSKEDDPVGHAIRGLFGMNDDDEKKPPPENKGTGSMYQVSAQGEDPDADVDRQVRQQYAFGGQMGEAKRRADRYEQMGLDQSRWKGADEAMALQRQAALGNTPSQAERLASLQGDRAAAQQASLAASARGPAAMAAAQSQAMGNAASAQQGIAQQAFAGRAGEMENARNAYAAGSMGLAGQKFGQGMAGLQASDQMTQAGDRGRIAGYNAVKSDVLRAGGKMDEANAAQKQADNAQSQSLFAGLSGGLGALLPLLLSDESAKQNMTPLDSYSGVDTKDFTGPYDAQGNFDLLGRLSQLTGKVAADKEGLAGAKKKVADDYATKTEAEKKEAKIWQDAQMKASIGKKASWDTPEFEQQNKLLLASQAQQKEGAERKTAAEKIYEDQKKSMEAMERKRAIGALASGGMSMLGGLLSPDKSKQIAVQQRQAQDQQARAAMLEQAVVQSMLSDESAKQNMSMLSDVTAKQGMSDMDAAALSAKADAMFGRPKMADAEAAKLAAKADKMFGTTKTKASKKDESSLDKSVMATLAALKEYKSPLAEKAQSGDKMAEYLAANKGAEYTYKPEMQMQGAPAGKQYGPASAQEIAKTEIGKQVIKQDPLTGKLAIDGQQALKAGMAADNYLAEENEAQNKKLDIIARLLMKGIK